MQWVIKVFVAALEVCDIFLVMHNFWVFPCQTFDVEYFVFSTRIDN